MSHSHLNISDHPHYQINKNADLIYPNLNNTLLRLTSEGRVPVQHLTAASSDRSLLLTEKQQVLLLLKNDIDQICFLVLILFLRK